jgi:hypothetical protein
MLYRSRKELTGARADRNLLADILIGFGVWHVIDAVLSHWLTGIHRIRMDVPEPILWDLGWLALFGLPPLVLGLLIKRRYPRRESLASIVAVTVLPGAFFASLKESDARVLWSNRTGGLWVLTASPEASSWRYYRHGAMYVSGSLLAAGCSAWIRA